MAVFREELEFETRAEGDIVDLTERVAGVVARSGLREGIACVFATGSTAAVTTMEFESGLRKDLPAAMDRLVPRDAGYAHNRGGDDNGHSHVRSSLVGPGLSLPFAEGRLALGTWQQIVFLEFDRRRRRTVLVQLVGA